MGLRYGGGGGGGSEEINIKEEYKKIVIAIGRLLGIRERFIRVNFKRRKEIDRNETTFNSISL